MATKFNIPSLGIEAAEECEMLCHSDWQFFCCMESSVKSLHLTNQIPSSSYLKKIATRTAFELWKNLHDRPDFDAFLIHFPHVAIDLLRRETLRMKNFELHCDRCEVKRIYDDCGCQSFHYFNLGRLTQIRGKISTGLIAPTEKDGKCIGCTAGCGLEFLFKDLKCKFCHTNHNMNRTKWLPDKN